MRGDPAKLGRDLMSLIGFKEVKLEAGRMP